MTVPQLAFVGTYSDPALAGGGQIRRGKGIHAVTFDAAAATLVPLHITEGVRNASFLAFHPNRRFLYCVNELQAFDGEATGAVSAFAIDAATGGLTFLNMKASHGTDPCHISLDASGRNLLVANYSSGSVSVLPVAPDGALADASAVVQHEGAGPHPKRQAGPHTHAAVVDPANRFVFVPDLGLDKVMIYRLDAERGRLESNQHQPFAATAPGAGPRQIAMHPGGQFAYLINELDSTMTAYRYHAAEGRLEPLQTLSTLPENFHGHNTCAEVQVTPSGRFVYGSNRGHDSIVIYAVDEVKGTLTTVGHESSRGRTPRNFDIDPTGAFLVAANQDSDSIVVFRIDPESGALAPTGGDLEVGTPVCVRFL